MSLEKRLQKAEELVIVKIPNTPTATFGAWGSKDDFYRITLTKPKNAYAYTVQLNYQQVYLENILAECVQDGNLFGDDHACQGNSKHTICYHAMAAIMFALEDRGQEIEFCRDEIVARGKVEHSKWDRYVNNYHFALIQSKQGRGSMWAVIRGKMKTVNHSDMKQRVNLMRGVEEEGID